MEIKLLEIRDVGTFIPVMCVAMKSYSQNERYLLGRLGFGEDTHLIQLVWISANKTQYDPFKWNDRTLYNAHSYITENWGELQSGDVIDVEYILGEKYIKKLSEKFA